MKNRITVLSGVSGSGKSTWAHEKWLEDSKNIVIVNRDKIRELLFGYTEDTIKEYYDRDKIYSNEKLVTRFEDTMIYEALNMNKDIIVDSTNLKRAYIERFAYWNVSTTYKMFPVTLKEAEVRDMNRSRRVGAKIIHKQYDRFKDLFNHLQKQPIDFSVKSINNNKNLEETIIFDIDGTIALKGDRSPYEWRLVGKDTVEERTADIMDIMKSSGVHVTICTGRDGISLYETQKWLERHDLHYDQILIRPKGDTRPDWVVKEEMWREISKGYFIKGLFDDRMQVVRRARALGLKVFNVEYNNF